MGWEDAVVGVWRVFERIVRMGRSHLTVDTSYTIGALA